MADPASLTLGIIPLVGVAVKSYATVYKKISTFVHCSAKLKRIQKRFKLQRRIFENEYHLLLRFALANDATINSMKADPDHENWSKTTIDDELKQQLGANYEPCLDIVQDTGRALSWLQDQLRGFDALQSHQLNGEDIKQTLKRLQGQVTMAVNESTYDEALADIKNANSDLGALREQITALTTKRPGTEAEASQHTCSQITDCVPETTMGWNTLCKVRRASKALYSALAEVWSCQEVNHTRHLVNLAIQPEGRPFLGDSGAGEASLDLAVLSWVRDAGTGYESRLLQLLVRSQVISQPWATIGRPLTVRTVQQKPGSSSPRSRLTESNSTEPAARPKKRAKVVRFVQNAVPGRSFRAATTTITESPSKTAVQQDGLSVDNVAEASSPTNGDLSRSKNICSDLARIGLEPQSLAPGCLGFLDYNADEVYRHSFHKKHGPGQGMTSYGTQLRQCNITSLDSFLDAAGEKSLQLTVVDKLRLARSLVQAVLQFHCTPWMREMWRLGDVSFLRQAIQEDDIMSSAIKSLYLGVEFSSDQCHLPASIGGTTATPSPSTEQLNECRVVYGVTNLTLHSLGAALVQIDQWSATGIIQPQDVPAVRKMALRPSSLGPRFDEMIQRCIQCRFNYGFDLNRPQMQKEVYDKLVTPLEDMIASMSLKDDDGDGYG